MEATSEPIKQAGEIYFEAQMSSLEEMVTLRRENPEDDHELIINEWCLEVTSIRQAEQIEYFDEETQTEMVHLTGMDVIEGHKFLLTWGGPSAWIESHDNGETFTYSYCDWFESDAFSCPILGDNLDNVKTAFEIYFECLDPSQKVGSIVEAEY